MKTKKFLSCVLALVLALSTVGAPALAEVTTFPDIETHWARENIERMTARGIFNGFEDGTFRPENLMLTSEALAMCARVGADDTLRAQMEADWADVLDALLGDGMSWFRDEFAACLELGILDYDELEQIILSGQHQVPMQKAEFAKYLTRAMGLGNLAGELTNIRLTYADADIVPVELLPYVYLLTLHGVVNGTPENEIQPLVPLARAVAATMVDRVLEARENLNVSVELPRYTSYACVAGYITDVTAAADGAAIITVDGMSGPHSVTLPADAPVYQNNMPAKRTELKAGAYARLILNALGQADAVRLIPAERLAEDSGSLIALTEDQIMIDAQVYNVNRFTIFAAGGKTGDWSTLDPDAGYSSAECVTDGHGTALFVSLKGGTRETGGLLSGVEVNAVSGAVSISVSGYDGRVQRYAVPSSAVVTAGGLAYTLKANENIGAFVTLRVANDDLTAVSAVELDLLSKFVQGSLNTVNSTARTVTISELPGGRTGTYNVDADCVITFNGASVQLSAIKSSNYVTARFLGGEIVELSVWPGTVTTTGKLVSISYADTTTLHVATESGVIEQFSIPLDEISDIRITRGGSTSSINYLTTGDTVTVTVVFHRITTIAAKAQDADVTGVVNEISFNANGASIALDLPDGSTVVYTAAQGITVTQDGNVVPLNNIKPGMSLAAVTEGSRIISAVIQEAAQSATKLVGTIYLRETSRRLSLMIPDGAGGTRLVVVIIPDSVSTASDTLEGSISLTKLQTGDTLEVWGAYNKQEFIATLVVRTH